VKGNSPVELAGAGATAPCSSGAGWLLRSSCVPRISDPGGALRSPPGEIVDPGVDQHRNEVVRDPVGYEVAEDVETHVVPEFAATGPTGGVDACLGPAAGELEVGDVEGSEREPARRTVGIQCVHVDGDRMAGVHLAHVEDRVEGSVAEAFSVARDVEHEPAMGSWLAPRDEDRDDVLARVQVQLREQKVEKDEG
jgi:hypothetical protein